jgi:hypothetical protein
MVLLRQHTFDSVCGQARSRCRPTTSSFPQRTDVLPVATLEPLVFRNLVLEPHFVGSLVKPFDTTVLKFALSGQQR